MTWVRLGLGLAAALLVGAALFFSPLRHLFSWEYAVVWVEKIKSNHAAVALFFIVFALAVLILPITPFTVMGGVLLNFGWALPCNLLATTAGAWLAFVIARFFGREAVQRMLKGRFRSLDRLAVSRGFSAVLLLRWIGAPPFMILNYLLGLSGIKTRDYLLGTLCGLLPWMAIVTYASHSIWAALIVGGHKGFREALQQVMGPVALLSAFVLIVAGATIYIKQRKKGLLVDFSEETEETQR